MDPICKLCLWASPETCKECRRKEREDRERNRKGIQKAVWNQARSKASQPTS